MAKKSRRSGAATLGWTLALVVAAAGLFFAVRFGERTYRQNQRDEAQAEALQRAQKAAETGRQLLGRGDLAGAAREYLAAYELGLRSVAVRFTLPWLLSRLDLEVAKLPHDKDVLSVAFAPDGKRAVTGSADKSARIFEVPSGKLLQRLVGHDTPVLSAVFSSDGSRVLTLANDSTCRLWDSASGKAVATLKDPAGQPWLCRFSPDGGRVVTIIADKSPSLSDSSDGHAIAALTGHPGPVLLANFSADGKRLVTASGQGAYLWDGMTGKLITALRGHTENVKDAEFSPDGSRVVTTSADQTARLWDGQSGQFLMLLEGHSGTVYSATFTLAGGKAIMTVSADGTSRLWNSQTGQPLFPPVSHPRFSQILLFSKDGGRMITRSEGGSLELWDRILGHMRGTLTVGPDSDTAAGSSRGAGKDADSDIAVAFSPNGRRIVTGGLDGVTRLWDGRSGQALLALKGHEGRVRAVAFSPDSGLILTGSSDGTARLWRSRSDRFPRPVEGHQSAVTSIDFSPDGNHLLSASRDGSVRTWDAASGDQQLTLDGPRRSVDRAFFTADGQNVVTVIAGDSRGNLSGRTPCVVRVLDATTGELRAGFGDSLDLGRALAVSPAGDRVVSAAASESRAQLYQLSAPPSKLITSLEGHKSLVTAATFSSDGKILATASEDHTVRLWDGRDGQLLRQLDGPDEAVMAVAFSFDGRRLVIGAADRTARLFDTANAARLGTLGGQIGTVGDVRFSPDGQRVLTVDSGDRAWLWNSREASLVAALAIYSANNKGHNAVAYSRDSSRVVGAGDELRIYDGASGLPLLNLDSATGEHSEVFTAAVFSPDGNMLATGAKSGAVKLWDVHLESRPAVEIKAELDALLLRR